ncbi:hypothetical protein E3P77_00966 [Wallemia ichthyophaga]|uniref:ATPase domain-containing protein n=1 Tax=Wallemia ichthyophaga TaxID=245174 RepID=A0A4T0IB31_WALIC|nr:hypothetical protein E3P91_01092 [Wallemia ichthyophaga]TIA82764.1 hypothetical protein E3P98_01158 [Wallemia ichthyophaga]TIA92638.1 hypothetical protein E3P97_01397 [Wallemia ichthyophaga]TIB01785.1 hypothetical protein E3P95_01233 [Wallemia ichthyophaga]TIB02714.1 hypothetical protein E3P94_01365 [Wallemia ichthyophaga]
MLRRTSLLAKHYRKSIPGYSTQSRSFFGIGDVLGAIGNPKETLSQITEAKNELEKVKNELVEMGEKVRLPPVRTFVRQPNYFSRKLEEDRVRAMLDSDATFTVFFGAASTGKTCLIRHVLTDNTKYIVLPIDLRISAFTDPATFYMSLSTHLEAFFNDVSESVDGFEELGHRLGLGFKHARIDVERRGVPPSSTDISRLMELFQNALLNYWNYDPSLTEEERKKLDNQSTLPEPKQRVTCGSPNKLNRKIPVLYIDEAHRLPQLLDTEHSGTLKIILDGLTVLTKQERLLHTIFCTSDSMFMSTLVDYNVLTHTQVLHVTDPSKDSIRSYLKDHLLLQINQSHLHPHIIENFDNIYSILGGKYIHWKDYLLGDWLHDGLSLTQSKVATHAKISVESHLYPSSGLSTPPNTLALLHEIAKATDDNPLDIFDARRRFGQEVVDALLCNKILEVRWGNVISRSNFLENAHMNPKLDGRSDISENKPAINPLKPASSVMGWAIKEVLKKHELQ